MCVCVNAEAGKRASASVTFLENPEKGFIIFLPAPTPNVPPRILSLVSVVLLAIWTIDLNGSVDARSRVGFGMGGKPRKGSIFMLSSGLVTVSVTLGGRWEVGFKNLPRSSTSKMICKCTPPFVARCLPFLFSCSFFHFVSSSAFSSEATL